MKVKVYSSFLSIFLLFICLFCSLSQAILSDNTFPRLVNIYAFGGYSGTFPWFARYHLLVGGAPKAGVHAVKALNPSILVVQYLASEEVPVPSYNGLNISQSWWLTNAGTTLTTAISASDTVISVGNVDKISYLPANVVLVDQEVMLVKSVDTASNTITVQRGYNTTAVAHTTNTRIASIASFWPGTYMLNASPYCPVDPITGLRWMDYLPIAAKNYVTSTDADGVFYDNVFAHVIGISQSRIDVNNDNIVDMGLFPSGITWTTGERHILDTTKQLLPASQSLVLANSNTWTGINGRFIESLAIKTWSNTLVNTILEYLAIYENSALTNPPLVLIGVDTGNTRVQNLTTLRCGLAVTLLGDGYFSYDIGDQAHGQAWWYDEYDNGAGTSLVANVSIADTTLRVATGTGSLFKQGDTVWVTSPASNQEAMLVNSVEGDVLNVTRKTNSTSALSHIIGNKVFTESQVRDGMGYLGTPLGLATSEPDSTNFIKGDFEGQNWNTNWTFIMGLANISMSQDFTTKASGASSARFDINTSTTQYWNPFNYIKYEVPISVVKGQLYTFSVQAKSDSFMWIQSLFSWDNYANTSYNTFNEVTAFWSNYTLQFVSPVTVDNFYVRVVFGQGVGTIWIDNVKFQEGSPHLWTRYYTNGLVVSNLKLVSATFTPPTGYKRILGTQDPLYNNGKAIQSPIVLAPTEGAIFIKDTQSSSTSSLPSSSTSPSTSTSSQAATAKSSSTTSENNSSKGTNLAVVVETVLIFILLAII